MVRRYLTLQGREKELKPASDQETNVVSIMKDIDIDAVDNEADWNEIHSTLPNSWPKTISINKKTCVKKVNSSPKEWLFFIGYNLKLWWTRLKSLKSYFVGRGNLFQIKKSLNPEKKIILSNLRNMVKIEEILRFEQNPETGWNSGKEDYYISFEK